ncbi:MAG: D-amino-acid transaminase [Rhodospirillaceae bacterium]|nr:D-amino-acid transaminase [Rhodospirillaceae bacterium]
MSRVAYVNGRFVPHAMASVHIEDRGYQFADGVYEVIAIQDGKLVDEAGHIDRLDRSLRELRMARPMGRQAHGLVMRELIRRNRVRNGVIYMQVTRGVAPRNFLFPPAATSPSLVMTVRRTDLFPTARLRDGVRIVSMPDIRWKRRDIKSVGLLPQVLGKQRAAEAGAFEGWMLDESGFVTEGCSSNAWIVTRDGVLVTHEASHEILNGITRQSIIRIAREAGIPFEERAFRLEEAFEAREAFLTSASTYCIPIVRVDDRPIGNGHPGLLTAKLRQAYAAYAASGRTV